jgi:hypothetical protein
VHADSVCPGPANHWSTSYDELRRATASFDEEKPMRLDGVEIKVTVADAQVGRAMEVLELGDQSRVAIWFYEDLTTGMRLPLLEAGLILRARVKDSGRGGDLTVKLRPCRASQLAGDWFEKESDGELELRAEEDWAGVRQVLAVSAQADIDKDTASQVRAAAPPPPGLLTADQGTYLADCAALRVDLRGLTALGPIAATRWKSVVGPGLDGLGVRAERWTVRGLDFLELSVKCDPDEGPQRQRDLVTALAALGLQQDAEQETKTRRVLEALST